MASTAHKEQKDNLYPEDTSGSKAKGVKITPAGRRGQTFKPQHPMTTQSWDKLLPEAAVAGKKMLEGTTALG